MSKTTCFDVAILGLGVAGVLATYALAEKNAKVLGIELGRPPAKRRSQMCGFLGLLPFSDGKFYTTDTKRIAELTSDKKAKKAYEEVAAIFKNVMDFNLVKDRQPQTAADKRIKKQGFKLQLNNYIQLYPKDIHALSRLIAEKLENRSNITLSFDNEILALSKVRGQFLITTQEGEFKAKKVVMAVGRSGWRWAQQVFNQFGLIQDNQYARFGIRIEMPATAMKDFNKSNCTLLKEGLEVGPLSWNGTIVPEDHYDMAISAFRSNETRWKTDKVSFSYIRSVPTDNQGFEQTDRIGKLTFILANDRITKERVSSILNKRSKLSILPDYDWLAPDMEEFSQVVPDLVSKGYFHVPTLLPLPASIDLTSGLRTQIEDLYVVGENTGVVGLLAAAETGLIVADSVSKGL
jgi:hypothetical protein